MVSRPIIMVAPQHAFASVFQRLLPLFTLGYPRRPQDLCHTAVDLVVVGPASELQLRSRFCASVEDSQVAELMCKLGLEGIPTCLTQMQLKTLCSFGNSFTDWLCKARVAALAAKPPTPASDLLHVQNAVADTPLANG